MRAEEAFGDNVASWLQGKNAPHDLADLVRAPWAQIVRDERGKRRFTPNQEVLLSLWRFIADPIANWMDARRALAWMETPDRTETGSGYRLFYRGGALGFAMALHELAPQRQRLFDKAREIARRGLAFDAFFSVGTTSGLRSMPPGVRCGTHPMGVDFALEYALGLPSTMRQEWPERQLRPSMPVVALRRLRRAADDPQLFSILEQADIRAWIQKREMRPRFAELLRSVRTRYPIRAEVGAGGELVAWIEGGATATDNPRPAVILTPGAEPVECRVDRQAEKLDFYGDASVDEVAFTLTCDFAGRLVAGHGGTAPSEVVNRRINVQRPRTVRTAVDFGPTGAAVG